MTFEDEKKRRERRIKNRRRDRDKPAKENKWWSPDNDKKPRRERIDWSSYEDEDEEDFNR